jgi:hypothetical protein
MREALIVFTFTALPYYVQVESVQNRIEVGVIALYIRKSLLSLFTTLRMEWTVDKINT